MNAWPGCGCSSIAARSSPLPRDWCRLADCPRPGPCRVHPPGSRWLVWSASRSGRSPRWSPAHRREPSRRRWPWASPCTTLRSCRRGYVPLLNGLLQGTLVAEILVEALWSADGGDGPIYAASRPSPQLAVKAKVASPLRPAPAVIPPTTRPLRATAARRSCASRVLPTQRQALREAAVADRRVVSVGRDACWRSSGRGRRGACQQDLATLAQPARPMTSHMKPTPRIVQRRVRRLG
jgi:hypothetical protein